MYFPFRRFVPILLAAILALATDRALAQPASDNELYAAYCVGAVMQRGEWAKKELKPLLEPNPWIGIEQDNWRGIEQDIEQRLSRFKAYLAGRGFPRRARDAEAYTGVMLAIKRGESDEKRCREFAKTCKCNQGDPLNTDAIAKCAVQCQAENMACRSVERCNRADNLPF